MADSIPPTGNPAIIGAGRAGGLAAIAWAPRGETVTLLEANPSPDRKFAGEWLETLGSLGKLLFPLATSSCSRIVPLGGSFGGLFPAPRRVSI